MGEDTPEKAAVRVKAFADLRKIVPSESDFPVETPVGIGAVMDAMGLPREKVAIIFVNGRHAEPGDAVKPGDVLSFFPPVGGG